jgi:hypothetical protein
VTESNGCTQRSNTRKEHSNGPYVPTLFSSFLRLHKFLLLLCASLSAAVVDVVFGNNITKQQMIFFENDKKWMPPSYPDFQSPLSL